MSSEIGHNQSQESATQVAAFKVLPVEPRIVTQRTLTKLQESGASSDLIDVAERAARKGS